jgi:thiamine-monophosphate kinase
VVSSLPPFFVPSLPAMEIGEFDLIARLVEMVDRARLESGGDRDPAAARIEIGSGDDAAVTVAHGATVTTVDALIEGVHFRRDTAPLRSIGVKALATALSDLAAMGAGAGEAYVQLGIPEDLDEAGCLELGEGLARVAAEHRVAVIGGDVSRAPVLMIATTAVGHGSSPEGLVTRSGARPGDLIAVTGALGGAAAGLLVLERPELGAALDPGVADELRRRQLEPIARLGAGQALAAVGGTAMIDVSDGLGADAGHVASASRVRLAIELARLPLEEGVERIASSAEMDPFDLATAAGEDYELLVTVPPDRVEAAREAVAASGVALTEIGAVEEGQGVGLREADGSEREPGGFDQLRRPR